MLKVREQFLKYHRDNPHVYEMFVRYAREARAAGRTRYSARDILARIRWEVNIAHRGEFKANNIASPFYARMLASEDESFAAFFELRAADADTFDPNTALHHQPPEGMGDDPGDSQPG